MNNTEFHHFDTDASLYQPGLLPHALSLAGQSRFTCEKDPLVRLLAIDVKDHDYDGGTDHFNGYMRNTWTIGGILMRDAVNDPKKIQPLSLNTNGYPHFENMFTNLYEEEKDRIMRTLHDDVLYARLYKDSGKFHEILNTRAELEETTAVVPPALLTTKTVLLPDHIRRGFRENRDGILDYLKQDITPGTFASKHFSNKNFETLAHMAHKWGNDIYPSQFVAMRYQYLQDMKTGGLHIGPTEETYAYTPGEREALFAHKYRQIERWNVYCVAPYMIWPVGMYDDVLEAAGFLQEAEAHFIDPYYKKDRRLAFLEDRLAIVSDFRPTHHSNLTIGHVLLARDQTIAIPN